MMNWRMLIKLKINRVLLFSLFLLLFISCSKKEDVDYIVRVGDSFLTQSMVDDAIGESNGNKLFREEFIRKWIEKRVIYLSAVDYRGFGCGHELADTTD